MSSAIEGGAPTRARQMRPGVVLLSAIAGGVLGIALLGHRFKSLSQERRQIKLALLDLAQAERDADAPPLLASMAELTGQLALVRAELSSCVMSEGSLRNGLTEPIRTSPCRGCIWRFAAARAGRFLA